MKLGAFLVLCTSVGALSAATQPIPERLPAGRYAKLKAEPPFSVAEQPPEVQKEEEDPFQGLHLSGAMQIKEGETLTDMVIVSDSNNPGSSITLFGNQPAKSGMQLLKLNWNADPTKTTAEIKRDSKTGILKRDQAAFVAAPSPGGPGRLPTPPNPINRPPTFPNGGGAIRPPGGGNIPKPNIPRPTSANSGAPIPGLNPQPVPQAIPAQGGPGGNRVPGGQDSRRRVRVINSQ